MDFTGADTARSTRNEDEEAAVPDDVVRRVADELAHPGVENGDSATAALTLSQRSERCECDLGGGDAGVPETGLATLRLLCPPPAEPATAAARAD